MTPLSDLGLRWTRKLASGAELFAYDLSAPRPGLRDHYLSEPELARARAMRSPRARRCFVQSRIALRGTLAWLCGGAPDALDIEVDDNGKPRLKSVAGGSSPGLHFSLSHSGDELVIATTPHAPLGVDIEQPDPDIDIESVAAGFFSPAEAERLAACPGEDRLVTFLRSWVRKEAVAKAAGHGLGATIDCSGVDGPSREVGPCRIALHGHHYLVSDLEMDGATVGAIAIMDQAAP